MNAKVIDVAAPAVAQREVAGPWMKTSAAEQSTQRIETARSSIINPLPALPPAPEGIVDGVCIEVEDAGIVETQWGPKHKFRVVWEIDLLKQDGTKFKIAKWYTASLHPKSNFRKDLAGWRGHDLTEEEQKKGYDYSDLIQKPCRLELIHKVGKDGNIYAEAVGVLPPNDATEEVTLS